MESRGDTFAWRLASGSPEIAAKLRAFTADGCQPRPAEGETYYFLPLESLPWPKDSDPDYWMHDVQRFYIDTYRPKHADHNDILFANTDAFGEVVIVPFRFLPTEARG